MSTNSIHETAIVSSGAKIASGVSIGPYAVIEDCVEIGTNSKIEAHAILRSGSILGEGVLIDSHAVVAGAPQDFSFDPSTVSYARIGNRSVIREGVTISRSTKDGGETIIGEDCLIMAVSHVAHDCRLGDRVVLVNGVLLAGHVEVGSDAFLGGCCGIHQFCRIGDGSMVAGHGTITQDVPPFTMVAGRNELHGLNLVGLRRRKHSRESIRALKDIYQEIFNTSGNIKKLASEMLYGEEAACAEVEAFLSFIESNERGIARPLRQVEGESSGA